MKREIAGGPEGGEKAGTDAQQMPKVDVNARSVQCKLINSPYPAESTDSHVHAASGFLELALHLDLFILHCTPSSLYQHCPCPHRLSGLSLPGT